VRQPIQYVAVLILLGAVVLASGATGKLYQTGKIVEVEQKTNTTVLYYLVNTPVTRDDPYYQVTVQLKNTLYIAEYTPRHAADGLPVEWVTDAPVEVRVEKRHIFLKRPGGDELDFAIIKRKTVASASATKP